MDINSCPLCGSTNKKIFSKVPDSGKYLFYWRCPHCGLIFQSPQMNEVELHEFYSDHYRKHLFNQVDPPQIDIEIQQARAKHLSNIIKEYCGSLKDHVHLDIGCGDGALVNEIQRTHFSRSFGIEPDNAYRKYAISQSLTVYSSLNEWYMKAEAKAKLVTLSHVLEHFNDPVQYLSNIREKVLNPDGFLLVEVPNLYFHRSYELAHNYAFSLHTLKEVLHKSGFDLIFIKKHGIPLKITPRYLTVVAQPKLYPGSHQVKPDLPGVYLKRVGGMSITKIEDLTDRFLRKIRRRILLS